MGRSDLHFYVYDGHPNTYSYVNGNPLSSSDPSGLDTYTANRQLAVQGKSAKLMDDRITHTFTFTTNPDGSVAHTYSWGNDANLKGWNLDQPIDIGAARQALRDGVAVKTGPAFLDRYVQRAFDRLNKPENEHLNLFVTQNCKRESEKLQDLAWKLFAGQVN